MLNEEKKITLKQYLSVVFQLGLFLLVVRQFQIENPAFLRLALLTSVGFMVHALLPLRYRLLFFLLLSFGGIGLIFGFPNSLWLVGIGFVLIGICHLPLSFATRIILLLITVGILVVLRIEWISAPWSSAVWPILGSMFMFRLIVYLYDLRHENVAPSVTRTLSYFFLLPNVCFPLFPVVDYKTFRRTYYDDDPSKIYQRGMDWMARGVIQLLLYRVAYYYLTIAPAEVVTIGDLLRYLIGNTLLYLRISGQFHLVVGMLHLFGFHLPETHHQYYLASSFTDYWRRINIYWKDFMLKIFYYPAYFQLRHWGNTSALVGSTLIVFVATWFLHAYQWFWLRGSFLLAWQDILFWVILATLVVINSLYEAKYPRERSFRKAPRTFRSSVGLVLQTSGTFIVICILWSLWTSESIDGWLSLWTAIGDFKNMDGVLYTLLVLVLLLGLFLAAVHGNRLEKIQRLISLRESAIVTPVLLFSLSLIGTPAVYTQLGPKAATTIYPLQTSGLNWMEVDRLERGYYEELLTVDRFNTQLWEVYMNRPLDWLDVKGGGLARPTGDFLQRELIPSSTAYAYRVTIHTNKWGMRDQEYEKLPPPNTYRIAMLGASPVMGIGVEDNETFESLLENRLNQENLVSPYANYEVLNFAAVAYKPLQQLIVLEKALAFMPNAVFYVATHNDAGRAADYLLEVVRNKVDIPYSYLQEVVRKAEIDAETSEPMANKRIRPFADEILSWLYLQIVENCRSQEVVPVWVYLPMPGQNWPREKIDTQIRRAEESGFVVFDLRDLYENQDIDTFRLAEWDAHPNAAAHQLIASRLYTVLQEKKASIFPHLTE